MTCYLFEYIQIYKSLLCIYAEPPVITFLYRVGRFPQSNQWSTSLRDMIFSVVSIFLIKDIDVSLRIIFTVSCAKSCFVLVLSIASIDILLSFTIYLFEQILIQKCAISFAISMCQNTKCVTKVMCHNAHRLVYQWQLGATFYI